MKKLACRLLSLAGTEALALTCAIFLPLRADASLVTPIYAIAQQYSVNYSYQFGVFDLGSPTGSPGSYQYVWTSLGSASATSLRDIALNPVTSQMYVQYGFTEYHTISTGGVVGTNLGTGVSLYGMAFDAAANLYGVNGTSWFSLDPSTGATNGSVTLGSSLYSQYGGSLAYSGDGNFYFGNSYPSTLYRITPGGVATSVGALSGTSYNSGGWNTLFSSGPSTYLLNSNSLYQINLTDASMTLMGTVTGLPGDFYNGFSGAVGIASAPVVPEPGTWAAAALLVGAAGYSRWRKRAKVS